MSYTTTIDATATLGLFVDVTAGINLSTGKVTWTFTSIDPTTLDLTSNPLAGFLPPDETPPQGEGSVSYTIKAKANLASGAVVSAQATVVFDTNKPISTAVVSNKIDTTVPTSSVEALQRRQRLPSFTVSWSGSDGAGSGIASYDVFVSTNGGPFQPLETGITATSATFTGQIGDTYGFYSVATSNVGPVQPTPKLPQATTTVITKPSPPPLVTVESLQIEKEKVGKGKKAKKESVLVLQFSGPLTAATADSVAPTAWRRSSQSRPTARESIDNPRRSNLGRS